MVPACIQTYFYNAEEQVQHRLQRFTNRVEDARQQLQDAEIFRRLANILNAAPNSYLTSYLSIQEQIDAGNIPQEVFIQIHAEKKPEESHSRRYNLPTTNELGILIPNEAAAAQDSRSVVCKFRAADRPEPRHLQHFTDDHRSYDPLVYPLLFPYGTDGFHRDILIEGTTKKVTAKQFYAHRIMTRRDSFNVLQRANNLYQQYLVDMYAKIETSRLNYLRFHQEDIRAELRQGLQDAVLEGILCINILIFISHCYSCIYFL